MKGNILGIVGSYRRGGTIDQAVSAVLATAAEVGAMTEKIHLLDRNIEFCTNCRRCTQEPGEAAGTCPLRDDMADLIARIEEADALVLGTPVNCGGVNALTQRFLERLTGFAYWPWGEPAPKMRRKKSKKAVLVTSSAMPEPMGRLFTGSLRGLKLGATALGCRTIGTLFIGLAAGEERPVLRRGSLRRARTAGRKLVLRP